MSKLALYRKYRPTNFDEIFGQDHISVTLKNSVKNNNFSHAYLFYGPRGTGKTSAARVFARAINCLTPTEGNPDNTCANCKIINDNKSVDIIEIDAASHTQVDNIREVIIERAKFTPTNLKYKVYIIDEAHMLSKSSFNALLKTLEEPPEHSIFILATTEIHKIIPTIQSRCQKFDFHKIDEKSIIDRLSYIAKKEKIAITSSALSEIAKVADGGFRDAISILDQLADSSTGEIDESLVKTLIGSGGQQNLDAIVDSLLSYKTKETLELLDKSVDSGVDPAYLAKEIVMTLRNYALNLINETTDSSRLEEVTQALDVFIKTETDYKYINMPRLALEVSVIKFTKKISTFQPEAIQNTGKQSNRSGSNQETKSTSVTPLKASDKTKWQQFLLEVKSQNNSIHAVLKVCSPEFEGDGVCLYFPYKFHKDKVDELRNRQMIEESLERVYGQKIKISSVLKANMQTSSQSSGKNPAKDDLLDDAIGIFGGEVID